MADESKSEGKLLTLSLRPRRDQAYKPSELIQITGHENLTLNARRSITLLWHNAHLQGIEEGRDYEIEIDDLKTNDHKGYEMVVEAVKDLMRTLVTIQMPGGKTRRVQFLGGNDMDDPDRPAGVLTYSFDKRLIEILKDSAIWGKIAIPVLMAFTSKYAISLYENIAQRANLRQKTFETFTLEEVRGLLGVEQGKYRRFGELNKHVIKPAVAEVNALAAFNVDVLPIKKGKRVVELKIAWHAKDTDQMQAAWQEINRSKVGRKARMAGQVETVHEPMPSVNRLVRNDPVITAFRQRSGDSSD